MREVLVVGAEPTGLTHAASLASFGVGPRLVDRGPDQVHESRAVAIQPRTLEALERRRRESVKPVNLDNRAESRSTISRMG
ncbi:FAD-dependent monooxygenase [Micromonospora sp. GCM10011542]|uniref:FAD-dependent monooxygenase n=1 Tax=Micromonospora sp. GCM10011542 TaxID=3317337 RepID=UPI00361AC0D9